MGYEYHIFLAFPDVSSCRQHLSIHSYALRVLFALGPCVACSASQQISSADRCFDRSRTLEGPTWTFTCEDRSTTLHSASVPASDSCCKTCPKDPSRLAWGRCTQTDGCYHALLASRMRATLGADRYPALACLQMLAS